MKRSRFTEEQIVGILKEVEAGATGKDVCRRHGISEQTLYNWKAKFGGMQVSDAKRLRQLEAENAKLKRVVADLTLDKEALKELLAKKLVKPAGRRRACRHLIETREMSERRACRLVGLHRSVARYCGRPRDDSAARTRLRELAGAYRRYGYLRLHVLLRNEGLVMNHKRTYRLYREEDLSVRRRKRKRLHRERVPLPPTERRNQRWAMDFVSDSLWTGRRFRALVIVDGHSKESPAILADFSISRARIVRLLDELAASHGLPEEIVTDKGPEFTS